ncbi:MAG: nucleoside phosphorylase [Anaerolineaceae bacterium]
MEKQHHIQLLPGDIGETVFLPGDVSRAKVIADHFDSAELVASNRQYNTYTGMYKGVKVSVTSTGIGGAAAAIAIEELVKIGAKNLIRIGTGGMMQTWLPSPGILVITGAVSGEGLTREYFPQGFPAVADFETVEAMLASAKELGIEVFEGYEWSHDSFYAGSVLSNLDILEIEKPWIDAGVLIASQEASTVLALSNVRKCRGGVILASAGCHQHPELEATDEQMVKAISDATRISLETAVKLYKLDHGK